MQTQFQSGWKRWSNPKPGHNTVRSEQGGPQHGREQGRNSEKRDTFWSIRPEDSPSSCPTANRRQQIGRHCPGRFFGSTNRRNVIQANEWTTYIYSDAVDNRFINKIACVLPSWLLTSVLTLICFCKLFSYRHVYDCQCPNSKNTRNFGRPSNVYADLDCCICLTEKVGKQLCKSDWKIKNTGKEDKPGHKIPVGK